MAKPPKKDPLPPILPTTQDSVQCTQQSLDKCLCRTGQCFPAAPFIPSDTTVLTLVLVRGVTVGQWALDSAEPGITHFLCFQTPLCVYKERAPLLVLFNYKTNMQINDCKKPPSRAWCKGKVKFFLSQRLFISS